MLIAGFSLLLTGHVTAQTFTTLHNFSFASYDGDTPEAGLILSGSTLYGTTVVGGTSGNGVVFALNTNGYYMNLYSFSALENTNSYGVYTNSDGAYPQAVILLGNTLYGTAPYGGNLGNGTVFAVNTNGSGFTTLHNFTATDPNTGTNSDGANPYAGLILSGNTLYGAAANGGSSGEGTVFAVNTNGTGFTNLHSFTECDFYTHYTNADGANPDAGLILSGNTLYGTARGGGSSDAGTVFAVNTNGTGFTNLHSFTGSDGANPIAGLILSGNTLYGTAEDGGSSDWRFQNGTVFAVNTNGTGFTNLHSFTGSDGANPYAGLILSGNTLYGTAEEGGSWDYGTVFAVNTNGTGFTNLYSFTATDPNTGTNSDGANPFAGLILSGNTLYGTTYDGGSSGVGTVFSISFAIAVTTVALPSGTNGVAYNQTLAAIGGQTPYNWTNSSGALPPGLTLATNGVISGTPTTNGTFNFIVEVTDTLSDTATQALALTVGSPPSDITLQPTNNLVEVAGRKQCEFFRIGDGHRPFQLPMATERNQPPQGIITTVAGNGTNGYSGDGGAAADAELY